MDREVPTRCLEAAGLEVFSFPLLPCLVAVRIVQAMVGDACVKEELLVCRAAVTGCVCYLHLAFAE